MYVRMHEMYACVSVRVCMCVYCNACM